MPKKRLRDRGGFRTFVHPFYLENSYGVDTDLPNSEFVSKWINNVSNPIDIYTNTSQIDINRSNIPDKYNGSNFSFVFNSSSANKKIFSHTTKTEGTRNYPGQLQLLQPGYTSNGAIYHFITNTLGTKALIVYRYDSKLYTLYGTINDRDITWGSPYLISSISLSMAGRVAMSDDGATIYVVYHSTSPATRAYIRSGTASSDNTQTWNDPVEITGSTGYTNSHVFICSADGSKAITSHNTANGYSFTPIVFSNGIPTFGNTVATGGYGDLANYLFGSSDLTKFVYGYSYTGTYDKAASISGTITDNVLSLGAINTITPAINYAANGFSFHSNSDCTVLLAAWKQQNNYKVATASVSGTTQTWSSITDFKNTSFAGGGTSCRLSNDGTKAVLAWLEGPLASTLQPYSASATISNNIITVGSSTKIIKSPYWIVDGSNYQIYIRISGDGTKLFALWSGNKNTKPNAGYYSAFICTGTMDGLTQTWDLLI